MKLHIVLSLHSGLPYEGPKATPDKDEAQATFKEFCASADLPEDNPHDEKKDVYWWEVEI